VGATGLASLGGHPERAAASVRGDRWWVAPTLTVFVLGARAADRYYDPLRVIAGRLLGRFGGGG